MTPEDKRILFRVAQWVCSGNRKAVETIRQLAETEQNYRVIIRESDRVHAYLANSKRRGKHAGTDEATWFPHPLP